MHELEERIESILMSLEFPCSEGDVRDAVQELLELKELVNSKKTIRRLCKSQGSVFQANM